VKLLAKGAEADLYEANFADVFFPTSSFDKIILKRRIPKGYRIPQIDIHLRRSRTISEAKIIHDSGLAGTNVPTLLGLWIDSCTLVMEKIEGTRLKEFISVGGGDGVDACTGAGTQLGILHLRGIVHGDPTTSNMILRDDEVFLIDFGLAEYSESIEKRAVDLHLLKTALKSTHYDHFDEYLGAVLEGYRSEMGNASNDVIERCTSIEKRGRYVER
jgi:TP53 regulating kinase-like protein